MASGGAERPARLFAYGTLQPGRLRWPVLAPYACGYRSGVVVPGALYDSGWGWPVASFGAGPGVPGTVVELDPGRLTEALAVLDEVEASATALLARIVVVAVDGTVAWAYHAAAVPATATPIAVWDVADER